MARGCWNKRSLWRGHSCHSLRHLDRVRAGHHVHRAQIPHKISLRQDRWMGPLVDISILGMLLPVDLVAPASAPLHQHFGGNLILVSLAHRSPCSSFRHGSRCQEQKRLQTRLDRTRRLDLIMELHLPDLRRHWPGQSRCDILHTGATRHHLHHEALFPLLSCRI